MRTFTSAAFLSLALVTAGTLPLLGQDPAPGEAQEAETQEQRIARLVTELGHETFDVREAAQHQLTTIGQPALAALRAALESEDPEIVSRAREAIGIISQGQREDARPQPQERTRPNDPNALPLPEGFQQLEGFQELDLESLQGLFEGQLPEGLREQLPPEMREMMEQSMRQLEGMLNEQGNGQGFQGGRTFRFSFGNGPNGQLEPMPMPAPGPRATPRRGDVNRGAFGMRLSPSVPALRAQLGIPAQDGLVVDELAETGLAAQQGVELYDVIVTIDGHPVRSVADLAPLREKACVLEIYRRAQLQTLELSPPAPDAQPEERRSRSF
jgi:hypothetical protein